MKKKYIKLAICTSMLFFITSVMIPTTTADGWHPSEEFLHLYEPHQKSVIYWNGYTEIMYLSSAVKTSNLTNIAWIVPIISYTTPEVTAGNMTIFEDLVEFFKPSYYWDYFYGIGEGRKHKDNISVIEIKEVDIYDVIIVKATNASDLIDWLVENNLLVPEEAYDIINSYVQKENCYFVINKLDLKNRYKDVIEQIENGTIPDDATEYYQVLDDLKIGMATPLRFEFTPPKAYFPLTISSLNKGYCQIDVYVIANKPVFDKNNVLKVDICKKITSEFKNTLDKYIDTNNADFVTRLFFSGNINEVTDDAVFELYNLENHEPSFVYISSDFKNLSGIQTINVLTWNLYEEIANLQFRVDSNSEWINAEKIEDIPTDLYVVYNYWLKEDDIVKGSFWTFDINTTDLKNGEHVLEIKVLKEGEDEYSYSQSFLRIFTIQNEIIEEAEELIQQNTQAQLFAFVLSGLIVLSIVSVAVISRKTNI